MGGVSCAERWQVDARDALKAASSALPVRGLHTHAIAAARVVIVVVVVAEPASLHTDPK